jgi:hypothetical protein
MGSMSMRIESNVIKFVDDIPSDTLIHSPKRTGSITGFQYTNVGFASVLDKGIEISMGFDKSTEVFKLPS